MTHAHRVDFLAPSALPVPGRLGLASAPGTSVGGWWADDRNGALRRDLHSLRHRFGTSALVTLMPHDELDRFGLATLPELARAAGMTWLHYGIVDMSVPLDERGFDRLVEEVARRLEEGDTVVAHCLGGLGRSGTLAAAVLVRFGRDAEDAIRVVRDARPGAVQTREQERWLAAYAAHRQGQPDAG